MSNRRGITVVAMTAALGGLGATPCEECVDRWEGSVAASKYVRHTTFVGAGHRYRVAVVPMDANADLVVSADQEWPPEPIACRAATGGKTPDTCEFDSDFSGPIHVFVVGGAKKTRYEVGIEVAD
ncbi:MAG: hypothetical protein AAF928_05850 [Myxococcota bacterium]